MGAREVWVGCRTSQVLWETSVKPSLCLKIAHGSGRCGRACSINFFSILWPEMWPEYGV